MRSTLAVFVQLVALGAAASFGGHDGQQVLNGPAQDASEFRVVTSDNVHTTGYSMRVKRTERGGLCDPTVTQVTGYLDIANGDHLFFWFFESRKNPQSAPLAAWFNGGPGAPSLFGLLMELGPCAIIDNGTSTQFNPFSWNSNANMLFIDQPLTVGYSYSERNKIVTTTEEAARDIYAFFQLFYEAFPKYSKAPFFLTGESYWGKYGPTFATEIVKHNAAGDGIHIPLEGLMMGNAFVDPYSAVRYAPEYVCTGPYAHLLVDGPDSPECQRMRRQATRCQKLIQACNARPSRFTCVTAETWCEFLPWKESPVDKKGLNPFDVRKPCVKGSSVCYAEGDWINAYLNREDVKAALGVPENVKFNDNPIALQLGFVLSGDIFLSTKELIAPLLEAGIRILNYAGTADSRCDYFGDFAWMTTIDHEFAHEIGSKKSRPWKTSYGKAVGDIITAGEGNFTFLTINEAGQAYGPIRSARGCSRDVQWKIAQAPSEIGVRSSHALRLRAQFYIIFRVRVVTSDNVHTAGYQMRVKTTAHGGLCDPTVTQSSGYLDIDTGDHLFFWFFEARNNSHKAPLAAWFNGGPGAPSMIGLLMELGPCNIEPNGTDTRFNPYSWNSNANMLFIDQPLSTGYSYSERNKIVSTSAEAARDIYAFLQLFYEAFPQHSKRPLFLTGESYWGKYGPNFATEIIKHNTASDGIHIPLEGLMMGNAIVDPYSSVRNSPEYICTGPYAHLLVDGPNGPECKRLRDQASTCGKLTTACNAWPSRFTWCDISLSVTRVLTSPSLAAEAYCLRLPWKEKPVLSKSKGLNPFDVRKACPGPLVLCYEEDAWIKTYLNRVDVKAALGVPENIAYDNGPDELGYAFILNGEFALSTKGLIAPLLDAGIRILNYAGKADSRCDYYGAFAWMPMINHQYAHEIGTIQATRWKTSAGDVVGEIVAAGGGNFIYLSIDEAGHMVPYDQPEATLDIFNRCAL
ncbi:Alpha/Beta hydrolase protein [Auriculariales sp. MPI-PUGE-AT-0066]|nr:Alpha/Beta hydrolase protein [Auriculariales sp. MPI-PUGE-AT-0066]